MYAYVASKFGYEAAKVWMHSEGGSSGSAECELPVGRDAVNAEKAPVIIGKSDSGGPTVPCIFLRTCMRERSKQKRHMMGVNASAEAFSGH